MNLIKRWLLLSLLIIAVSHLVSGITVDDLWSAVIAAFVLGLINVTLKPLMILLTLPFTLISLGLFLLIINAAVFQLAAYFVPGFHIASFWAALKGSMIVSFASWIFNSPEMRTKIEIDRRGFFRRSSRVNNAHSTQGPTVDLNQTDKDQWE